VAEGDYYKGSFTRKEDIQMDEGTFDFKKKESKNNNNKNIHKKDDLKEDLAN